MKQNRLNLYRIDIKYIRDLAKVDGNVMSVSPQISKEKRPFIGIIIICGTEKYCVPLSSPKPKHSTMKNDIDYTKIYDGNKKNQDAIICKANKHYKMVTFGDSGSLLRNRCCDFAKLESVLKKKL